MLVNCVVYEQGKKLADIPVDDISDYISKPGTFVWVALKDPEEGELEKLSEEFGGIHELALGDAHKGHQRPKLDEYGAMLFVVLPVVEYSNNELTTAEVAVFVGPKFVMSVRRGTQQGFTEVRRRCEQEPELLAHGPAYVLYALMDTVVDRYFPVMDSITADIEDVEERIFSGITSREQIEQLYTLKRKIGVLDHVCIPLLEVTSKLHGGRVPPICSGLHEYFRDVYDHLLRLKQAVDGQREMVGTAISMNLSLITLQENEVTKRLAAYAALIAVPTLIAGIYGMNFKHIPELEWYWGYPISLGGMLIVDAYLVYLFRKAKWM